MQISSTPKSLANTTREQEIAPKAFAVVLKRHQSIISEALDEFLSTPKASQSAAIAGEKLDLFLKHKASPNAITQKPHTRLSGMFPGGISGLSASIEADRPWLFKKLIAHPEIEPERVGKFGLSPLESAIRLSNFKAFHQLLASGSARIAKQTLNTAVCYGRIEMLDALLEAYNKHPEKHGQDAFILSQAQKDELRQQACDQRKEIERLTRLSPSERQSDLNQTVADAETSNNPILLRMKIIALAQAGAHLDERHKRGQTHLLKAAECGQEALLKSLIEAGADLEQEDRWNSTAIGKAAFHGKTACLKLLIEAGANLNKGNMLNIYPVYAAASVGHTNGVRLLIDNGAEFRRSCSGKTPFQSAIDARKFETVKLLESYMSKEEVRALREKNWEYQSRLYGRSVIC